jgi:hypothetical protein
VGHLARIQHIFIHFELTIAQRSLSCRQIDDNLLSITFPSPTLYKSSPPSKLLVSPSLPSNQAIRALHALLDNRNGPRHRK